MRWCEEHDLGYVFGMARNRRLVRALGAARLHLSYAQIMKPPPACGGQGGISVQGGESALRGHQSLASQGRCQAVVREALLHARGDGESHQGAATRPVRRPHQFPHDAGELASVVLLLIRLRADAWTSKTRHRRHRLGPRPVLHASAEAVEDRSHPRTRQLSANRTNEGPNELPPPN